MSTRIFQARVESECSDPEKSVVPRPLNASSEHLKRWTNQHAELLRQKIREAKKDPEDLSRMYCISLAQVFELLDMQPGQRFYSEAIKFSMGARLYQSVGGQVEALYALSAALLPQSPTPVTPPTVQTDEIEPLLYAEPSRRLRIFAWLLALVFLLGGTCYWFFEMNRAVLGPR